MFFIVEIMILFDFLLSGAIAVHSPAFLPNGPLHVALAADVNCNGSEPTLTSCAVSSYGNTCSLRNYAQVVCQGINAALEF